LDILSLHAFDIPIVFYSPQIAAVIQRASLIIRFCKLTADYILVQKLKAFFWDKGMPKTCVL